MTTKTTLSEIIENGYVIVTTSGFAFLATDPENWESMIYAGDHHKWEDWSDCETVTLRTPDTTGTYDEGDCRVMKNSDLENPFDESEFMEVSEGVYTYWR